MAVPQSFRSAFNGFNREDVVQYIEHINTKHTTEVNQLRSELQSLKAELAQHQEIPQPDTAALDAANARCAELEQEKAELLAALEEARQRSAAVAENAELEAYRRAERAERLASERAAQVYQQANSVLADATVQMDEAATQLDSAAELAVARIGALTQQLSDQMAQLQAAVRSSKMSLQNAAASMYAIRPDSAE